MWSFFVFVLLCSACGTLGGYFTFPAIQDGWYASLAKPFWTPPDQVFSIWIFLYIAMAVSGWLIWRKRDRFDIRSQLELFGLQLFLNLVWPFLFFYMRMPGYALLEILLLWSVIVSSTVSFYRVSRMATLLFVPYLLWVTFAVLLNYFIWLMNWGW